MKQPKLDGFLYVGAPIILPFAGLEILIVLSASYYVFRNVNRQEILTFTPEKLIIEKGRLRPETTTEFIREWAYVFIEKPTHPWYPLHVIISSKGCIFLYPHNDNIDSSSINLLHTCDCNIEPNVSSPP